MSLDAALSIWMGRQELGWLVGNLDAPSSTGMGEAGRVQRKRKVPVGLTAGDGIVPRRLTRRHHVGEERESSTDDQLTTYEVGRGLDLPSEPLPNQCLTRRHM